MLHVIARQTAREVKHRVQIDNRGTPEYCRVTDSIGWICKYLELQPELRFAGGSRGWIGDNPFIFLDTAKIQSTGWKPKLTIEQGIIRTLNWLQKNPWVLERR